ncbi:hypothetical protein ACFX13_047178 [Malus domestica]
MVPPLIGIVELVVHEASDDAGFADGLIPKEDELVLGKSRNGSHGGFRSMRIGPVSRSRSHRRLIRQIEISEPRSKFTFHVLPQHISPEHASRVRPYEELSHPNYVLVQTQRILQSAGESPSLTSDMKHRTEEVETSSRSRSCHGYISISSSMSCKFLQLSDPTHLESHFGSLNPTHDINWRSTITTFSTKCTGNTFSTRCSLHVGATRRRL